MSVTTTDIYVPQVELFSERVVFKYLQKCFEASALRSDRLRRSARGKEAS